MTQEYYVVVEGQKHIVVVSDEKEALLAAKEAGKASVGLWTKGKSQELYMTKYLVESVENLNSEYLEQVVRRNLGLPWKIAETKRLLIREFQAEDVWQIPKEPGDRKADRVFQIPVLLKEYIKYQYGFYGYGIWAVVEKESRRIVGKAGVVNLSWEDSDIEPMYRKEKRISETAEGKNRKEGEVSEIEKKEQKRHCQRKQKWETDALELGYHIFAPFRHQGYAEEACRAILDWSKEHIGCPVYAQIDASNQASVHLAESLGFRLTGRKCNKSGQWQNLYGWNC